MKVRDGFVLGLDLDGVCGDYNGFFRPHVAKVLEVPVETLGPVTGWDYTQIGWGIVSRAHYESLHAQAVEAGMFREMPTIPGVSKALWKLSDAGVHVRIITHRLIIKGGHARAAGDTIEWLQRRNLPYRDICFIGDKVKVGADLYVDDAPHNVLALRAAGAEAVVFDQGWNQDVPGDRIHNWEEGVEYILEKASA